MVLRPSVDFDPDELKTIFLDLPAGRAPFFVERCTSASGGLLVSLETIISVEQARALLNKPVLADAGLVAAEESGDGLDGYQLIDVSSGPVGTILRTEEHGAQLLFVVEQEGKELLLPAADELIEEIDDDKRTVLYRAPEGLIDMLRGS